LEKSSQVFISKGDLLNSVNKPIMTFVEHYSKTGNTDRVLISSMLFEEDKDDPATASRVVAPSAPVATSSTAVGKKHRQVTHSSNGERTVLTLTVSE
jgi:hypothetical protein